MRLSTENLRKLQLTQLRIAVEVTKLCEENGIRYVLFAGTALGARRHGGFIPWDDDLDLGMLRADYDRFVKLAKESGLPERLYLQEWRDDPHMAAPYAKVRLNDTLMLEEWSQHTGGHKGIFIDIFPLDSVPEGFVQKGLFALQLKFWIRLLHHQTGYTMNKFAGPRGLLDLTVRALSRFISQETAKRRLQQVMTRYQDQPSKWVAAVGGSRTLAKETILREWLTNVSRRDFEGNSFLCPADLDAYLAHVYGDFMKLPPVDERFDKHGVVDLDFGTAERDLVTAD